MSEHEYLIAKADRDLEAFDKALNLNPIKALKARGAAKTAAKDAAAWAQSPAAYRLKAQQAHNAHNAYRAASQKASDAGAAQRSAASAAARRKAASASYAQSVQQGKVTGQQARLKRLQSLGGDTGGGPGWIGSGNS